MLHNVSEEELGAKLVARVDKSRNSSASKSRMKLWMIRAITTMLLWTCVVQLMTLGEMWGLRLLKGWPSCFTHHHQDLSHLPSLPPKLALPPKSESFFVFQSFVDQGWFLLE